MNEKELTQNELDRQDFVDNKIVDFLRELSGDDSLDYFTEPVNDLVSNIRDMISMAFDKHGIMSELDFYPYIEDGH